MMIAMNYWLFKQEPGEYSFDDLVRDGETDWDGVTNALAQKHLRSVTVGDRVLIYHTGDEKAIVGIMKVSAGPTPVSDDSKQVSVRVKAVKKLKNPVSLAVIKANPAFAEWELVRISRLSVMPVPPEIWSAIVDG
jgi:predicted RNA-binding protein with PUA-like domain